MTEEILEKNVLKILNFKDGYRVYFFNKNRLHHIATARGEFLTLDQYDRAQEIKYADMKVSYRWWKQRWATEGKSLEKGGK